LGRKKPPLTRKLRTREHVIADLAVNHVERQALLCGFSVERMEHDYGIDLVLFTYTAAGEVESGCIFIQVKATERLRWPRSQGRASFRVSREDLVGWMNEFLPVILIVYDASVDRAHWIHVQGYFATLPGFNLFQAGKRITVHLPIQNVLDGPALRRFAALRDEVERKSKGN
jgi:uncharacterized protein DUF4365